MKVKCGVPGCKHDATGGTLLRSGNCLCRDHSEDYYFIGEEIEKQAAVVSALAVVAKALDAPDDCLAWGNISREGGRLQAMQSRHIQYLKLAGFERVDEGVE